MNEEYKPRKIEALNEGWRGIVSTTKSVTEFVGVYPQSAVKMTGLFYIFPTSFKYLRNQFNGRDKNAEDMGRFMGSINGSLISLTAVFASNE